MIPHNLPVLTREANRKGLNIKQLTRSSSSYKCTITSNKTVNQVLTMIHYQIRLTPINNALHIIINELNRS